MKICVIIPSIEQKKQAGVRIRYLRLQQSLKLLKHSMELIPIQDFQVKDIKHDVYLISKCYDARAFIVSKLLQEHGKVVGIDVFDDYFSQLEDSRFIHFRYWLRIMLSLSDFIICSTPKIKNMLIEKYIPKIPIHVMNDTIETIKEIDLKNILDNKMTIFKQKKKLLIAWFGMGDNPMFPVGVSDISSYGSILSQFRGNGFDVEIEILTNKRAMTAKKLALLCRLPIPYNISEWSEEAEKNLLNKSQVCFLPINGQNFSQMKSLNRAITALHSGNQIIVSGYDLYEVLSDYIYYDIKSFLIDLQKNTLKVSQKTLPNLLKTFNKIANPKNEVEKLISFYKTTINMKLNKKDVKKLVIIHGKESNSLIHKYIQKMNYISVGSPFSMKNLIYNILFKLSEDFQSIECYILKKNINLLNSKFIPYLEDCNSTYDEYKMINLKKIFPKYKQDFLSLLCLNSISSITAIYFEIMSYISEILNRLLPDVVCFYSEQAQNIPWNVPIEINEEDV